MKISELYRLLEEKRMGKEKR